MPPRILDIAARPADARVPYGSDPSQFADFYLPKSAGPHPVAIVVHGGFWRNRYDLGHMSHMAEALAARGIASWSIEYRRLGQAEGGWPGTFLDVGAAADNLRTAASSRLLDLARVVAVGFSAGGHLALWLGARHRIPEGDPLYVAAPLRLLGVVALAAVGDLRLGWELGLGDRVVEQLLGGAPSVVPHRLATASPYELLPIGVPQVLMHGVLDQQVPIELSRQYHARATAYTDPIELQELPDTGHFELIDPADMAGLAVIDRVERFLLR